MSGPDLPELPPPLQYSLRRMFQLTAACAVLMGLIVAYLPLGLIAAFAAAGFSLVWLAQQLDGQRGDGPLAAAMPLAVAWLGMLLVGLAPSPLLFDHLGIAPSLVFGGPGSFGACVFSGVLNSQSKLGAAALASHASLAALFAPACQTGQACFAAAIGYLVLSLIATMIVVVFLTSIAAA